MALLLSSLLTILILMLNQQPSFSFSSSKSDQYLYANPDAPSESESNKKVWPIIDYVTPDKGKLESDKSFKKRIENPVFLTDQYEKPRMVEFYAPWCGHCKHYKPHYIELGKETHKLNTNIDFFAVSCVAHSPICKEQGVRGYPTLKFFVEYNNTAIDVSSKSLSAKQLNEEFFKKYSHLESTSDNNNGADDNDNDNDQVLERKGGKDKLDTKVRKDDIYINAASSLSFALRSSIFMTNDALSTQQSNVFHDWLTILSQTLPQSESHNNHSLKEALGAVLALKSDFEYVVQSGDNLLGILETSHEKGLDSEQWTSICSKGEAGAGYTCGLWQLFHLVTVGLVHYNMDHQDDALTETNMLSTMHTADTIRNYIEHFFTCDECRLNFVQMYEECRFERCNRLSTNPSSSIEDWKQLSLWLWEVHNDVNVRLLHETKDGEVTETEEEEVKWPSKQDCPLCWYEGGGWNDDVVFRYLDSFYWPTVKMESKRIEAFNTSDDDHDPSQYSYFFTIGGVILLFGVILLRRGRRKYKSLKHL